MMRNSPRNILLVARREYLEQIRGRAFRISTVLVPALLVFLLGVSAFTGRKMASGRHIIIAADNAALAADIRVNLLTDKRAAYTVDTVAPLTGEDRQNLEARLKSKSIDGLLIIDNSASATPKVTYESQSSTDLLDTSRLDDAVDYGFLNLRLAQQGVSPVQLRDINKSVPIETLQVSSSGKTGKSQGMTPFYKAMLMTFLMTMPILLYGFDMARSVIEEKSSRIFEVMLAVARPDDLLTGKLLGVGAVGLTQIAIWMTAAVLFMGSALAAPLLSGQVKIHFTMLEAVLFPVYFILGFFLYSAFFSGLAATCETSQDLQMYISLAVIPTWTSFAILPFLLNNPNSRWVAAASIFPPTAPLVMVPRIGMLSAPYPWGQLALSLALMIFSIWAVIWFASRLYRVGILMYGKRATLPELLRWLRYS
ncbi:MAG: ABC transporter permease [Terracidiphilus sp.]|jgi:ABC-2 type transport system permease protein